MHEIFNKIAIKISHHYGYKYNIEASQKIVMYLQKIRNKGI